MKVYKYLDDICEDVMSIFHDDKSSSVSIIAPGSVIAELLCCFVMEGFYVGCVHLDSMDDTNNTESYEMTLYDDFIYVDKLYIDGTRMVKTNYTDATFVFDIYNKELDGALKDGDRCDIVRFKVNALCDMFMEPSVYFEIDSEDGRVIGVKWKNENDIPDIIDALKRLASID